jgi:small nuclear ribonucleoprotein E
MDKKNLQPLEALYFAMENNYKVEIHESETRDIHRGIIVGFDEYLNIVLDTGFSRYLLKGDCVSYFVIKNISKEV